MKALFLVGLLSSLICVGAVLNIHVVSHTHDDVGWLKTVDQYYYGANNSIYTAGVQYILDTVVYALQQDENRKFIYVEMAFFYRWWREQNNAMRQTVIDLVQNGQLEFINGGWTMHDEGCVHFEDMVDQMTLGHQFLYDTFGIVPKIGWQLDPFGHSSTSGLIDSLIGFEGLFFARMDYQDVITRDKNRGLEMWWHPSLSDPNMTLLTGMMHNGYCTPEYFLFEYGDSNEPIMDDPLLEDDNLLRSAAGMVAAAFEQASLLRHNDVMFAWGCDFMYQNAHLMYKNIEKLMNYINANQEKYNVTMFYSTPSIYAQAIFDSKADLPVKAAGDDFMPYGIDAHSYFTGYFVSHTTLKGFVRYSSHVLHAITSLVATSQIKNQTIQDQLFLVQEPNGVTTHHDAVTGTSKLHVVKDYAVRLNNANNAAYEIFSEVFGRLVSSNTAPPQFLYCPLLNESSCPASADVTSGIIPLVVYNPLGWENTDYVRIPVSTPKVSVVNGNGTEIPAQVMQEENATVLVFPATVQALGFTTFFIQVGVASGPTEIPVPYQPNGPFTIGNQFLQIGFDEYGNFESLQDLQTFAPISFSQEYLYYVASPGDNVSSSISSAYIFRPLYQTPTSYEFVLPQVTVYNGNLVSEVVRVFQADLVQIIRLYNGQNYIEIEDRVGPINITNDKNGKEIITRYNTNFTNGGTWYTDSNGIELLERKLNYRPSWNYTITEPVSGNYMPVGAITTMKDVNNQHQLSWVVDRSRASASLVEGELEIMLHRRCLANRNDGTGEPLNDSTIMYAKEWVVYSTPADASSIYRPLAKKAYHPFFLAFAPSISSVDSWTSRYLIDYAPLGITLPPNVQLLDFVPLPQGSYIIRFHHIYQVGEDAVLSQPVTFDITNLLAKYELSSIQETQLTGVAPPLRPDAVSLVAPIKEAPITLQPTEIRTFIVTTMSSDTNPVHPSVHIV